MRLTIDFNLRTVAIAGTCVLAAGVVWGAVVYANSVHSAHKAADAQAYHAACEQKKEQFVADYRFDNLIKEQNWILKHPDDVRLKGAPRGKQLEEELNGEYVGARFTLKEDEPPSIELSNFTGHDRDYNLNDSDQDEYYLVSENEQLMKAIQHAFGGTSDLQKDAASLGYSYGFDKKTARRNVIRAIRFVNIFAPYSETLDVYARTGDDPTLQIATASPLFCVEK